MLKSTMKVTTMKLRKRMFRFNICVVGIFCTSEIWTAQNAMIDAVELWAGVL